MSELTIDFGAEAIRQHFASMSASSPTVRHIVGDWVADQSDEVLEAIGRLAIIDEILQAAIYDSVYDAAVAIKRGEING
jgi:hypothetical protein